MGIAVGIDLGTTNSAVAVLRPNGKPEILKNREGSSTTPSVVLFQDFGAGDEPLIGEQAKRSAEQSPDDVVQYVKRYMGDPTWRFDAQSGARYSSEEVSALILKRLKEDAELALGAPVTDAVITVPAYFDDARRTATRHAGEIAGLKVLRVINEPTAAALSYGVDTKTNGNVMVYDLGGGTFDVTILSIHGNEFTVAATDGDRNLGGFDFDNALMKYLNGAFQKQGAPDMFEDIDLMVALRERAESAKKTLSTVEAAQVTMNIYGRPYRVQITRDIFDLQITSLLTRTQEIMEDTLEAAGLTWSDIDRVLLVGGSTRIPAVQQKIKEMSGKTPELGVNPDEAVALGAAIQAALSQAEPEPEPEFEGLIGGRSAVEGLIGGPIKVQDVTSQGLGALVYEEGTDILINSVIIPKNSPVPGEYEKTFYTREEGQTGSNVQVTQGDDTDPDFVTVVGTGALDYDAPRPKGSPIKYIYRYDINQIIEVELIDMTTNKSMGTFQIDRIANLKQEEVEEAAVRIGGMTIM
ncbi:MAG: Hsp70 family protein [Rothia sp. (in: high G+C Gram-positive bacteria)]|uniref:Hsp70 family protein n=1 Tax=Rothia sp. (in: high G+C Gram-positive bacteria) TaxID=1885016 RepID=UPI0026E0F76A|nr:Hsp70 family protein [Rothia sp. (in: high G+C Gram-positive bacteria)]MDO5751029.1 Hsp70 family protein [Rothia sp. (in: high G+C Gram-positive bacteria)]